MIKYKMINFFEKDNNEYKYLRCIIISLACLLATQIYFKVEIINNLEEEIINYNTVQDENLQQVPQTKKIKLISDIQNLYNIFGFPNIENISVENNIVSIKGKYKDMKILEKLKTMKDIDQISVDSLENKGDNIYFNISYKIGDE